MYWRIFFLLVSLLPAAAMADSIWADFDALDGEAILSGEEEDNFAGRFQFGYLASSGNTESTSFNGKLLLGWDFEDWRHAVMTAGFGAADETNTTAENYQAAYKIDRKLGEKNYLFGALNYDKDRFGAYYERYTEAVGYGRRIIETEAHVLDLEAGIGARQSELPDGTELDETIGRLAGNYKWQIAQTSSFSQSLAVESGDENMYIESNTNLASQLIGRLDLVLGYVIKRNSDVPPGTVKTDTITTVSIQYNF